MAYCIYRNDHTEGLPSQIVFANFATFSSYKTKRSPPNKSSSIDLIYY